MVELGLGFIPGAGTLLSVAFSLGVQLLNDPASFKADNVLNLSAGILATLIDSAGKSKKYVAPGFLPSRGTSAMKMSSMRVATRALESAPAEVQVLNGGDAAEKKQTGEDQNAQLTASVVEQRQVVELPLAEAFRRAGY